MQNTIVGGGEGRWGKNEKLRVMEKMKKRERKREENYIKEEKRP